MAGGKWSKSGKIRPGIYINVESDKAEPLLTGSRGTVLLPLIGHDYGPAGEFISIAAEAPDAAETKIGRRIRDVSVTGTLLIREALKHASTVIVYIPTQGAQATATAEPLTVTAKYGGTRGNDIRVTSAANPLGGFDVSVWLATEEVERFEGVASVADLVAAGSDWVDFTGEGDLVEIAGLTLSGGANGEITNGDITKFLDAADAISWNTLAFPVSEDVEGRDDLIVAITTKINALRDTIGKYRKAVVSNYAADYEGIINVTNGVVLADGTQITADLATAWVAGADAGTDINKTLTGIRYDGAVAVLGAKDNEAAEAAILAGEFFFSELDMGGYGVEYDINSLTTFDKPKDKTFRKNRVMRTIDSFCTDIKLQLAAARLDNNETGWKIGDGIGQALLLTYQANNAITNVSATDDFKIDRTLSTGDEMYVDVALQPVDSADKIFITVKVR